MTSPTDFWNQVGATDADAEQLYAYILERGTPAPLRDLANHLIDLRLQEQIKAQTEAQSRRAQCYQPKQMYKSGERLFFPALNSRTGVVKKIRAGDNPRLGEFEVILVQMDEDAKTHEFAAAYAGDHPLNQEQETPAIVAQSPEAARAEHGEMIRANLLKRLSADKEFVCIGDLVFLKGLLTAIPEGYLNIAEAAIEQANDGVPTSEMIRVLELPPNVKKGGVSLSLSYALAHDARFEDVGPDGQIRWYLTRLEPAEVSERPAILDIRNDRIVALAPELETIATDLFHETDLNNREKALSSDLHEITLVLAYPHRRVGTLPLVPSARALLPKFSHARFRFNFVDAATKEKFAGFAVADGNYLAGLGSWYQTRRLQPGALIVLRRHHDPLTLEIDYQAQRERTLWVRVAKAVNGQLTFAQERRPLAHKYDEEMLIVIGDAAGIDAAAERLRHSHPTLENLLEYVFPELAKLSGAGHVHAKTLYSAVNCVRRANLRAVMTALAESRAFTSAGGGYFVLNEAAR